MFTFRCFTNDASHSNAFFLFQVSSAEYLPTREPAILKENNKFNEGIHVVV